MTTDTLTAPTTPADLIAAHLRRPTSVPRRPPTSRRVRAAWLVGSLRGVWGR